jgi:pilus assembly protein CpaF
MPIIPSKSSGGGAPARGVPPPAWGGAAPPPPPAPVHTSPVSPPSVEHTQPPARTGFHTGTVGPTGSSSGSRAIRRMGAGGLTRVAEVALQQRLHGRIITDLRDTVDVGDPIALHSEIERLFTRYMADEDVVLSRVERARLLEQVSAEIMGFGPIQQLINSDSVNEIMVNGPRQVWVEQNGRITLTDITFKDDEHVMRIISRIVAPLGRRIDESSPMVDARLPDGSRVHAIIPPLAIDGPVLTIRKFARVPLTVEDLLARGTLTQQAVVFLEASVRAGLNLLVAGGTSSGKTTLLNVLSSFIPENERIITIEDAAELQLQQAHVIRLESRPATSERQNGVAIRELVMTSLRMRPDRIVVGECRDAEALDMLQAMNTGHDGCMTTVHSNSPRDALSRIETMSMMARAELPLQAIRGQISSAFDLIVYVERSEDGQRRVTHITEVQGFERDTILLQDVFRLETTQQDGQYTSVLQPTGIRPQVMRKLEKARIYLTPDFFMPPAGPTVTPGRRG